MKTADEFWSKVDKSNGPHACWTWKGGLTSGGYGGCVWQGKRRAAHRVAYEMVRGAIPDGLCLDHLCRNRACVNPSHLEAVTQTENKLRGVGYAAQNAKKTHCPQGHPLSGDNLILDKRGGRCCRECMNAAARKYYVQKARANGVRDRRQSSHPNETKSERNRRNYLERKARQQQSSDGHQP